MNKEIQKAQEDLIQAITNFAVVVSTKVIEDAGLGEVVVEMPPKTETKKPAKAKAETKEADSDEVTEDTLKEMSYNDLKKYAKSIGITATGSRDEITAKILGLDSDGEEDEEPEAEPVKETKKTSKSSKKSQKVEEPEEDEDEEDDSIKAEVLEAVADLSNEEIMDALLEVGIKGKGKREALIELVIQAVEDGKLSLGGDEEETESDEDEDDDVESDIEDEDEDEDSVDEDEEESEDESDDESEDEDDEEDETEEFDANDPKNPNMTKERKTAIKAYKEDIKAQFKNGEITRKDMVAWLNDFNGTKDKMTKLSDSDVLDAYIYGACLFVNDEGEVPEEEGAYYVNEVPYCCGHELEYISKKKVFKCVTCGNEYDAE